MSAVVSEQKKRGRRKKIIKENDVIKQSSKKSSTKKVTDLNDLLKTDLGAKTNHSILYLKCHIRDIDHYIGEQKWKTDEITYDPKVPTDFIPFSYEDDKNRIHHVFSSENLLDTEKPDWLHSDSNNMISNLQPSHLCTRCSNSSSIPINGTDSVIAELQENDLQKIKELKLTFYKNNIPDKKVDCFWCTYPYDNDPFYVLEHGSVNEILAHGSFCTPECGVAYLFQHMNWDDSAKVDSYRLMNHIYGSENSANNVNIKPACSPFYFLDKYYGNLSIQEYRRLSKSSNVMLCIDKPVTRVLPEIHEDNEKQFANGSGNQHRGNYKVKKKSEKAAGPSRNSIIRDNFRGGAISA